MRLCADRPGAASDAAVRGQPAAARGAAPGSGRLQLRSVCQRRQLLRHWRRRLQLRLCPGIHRRHVSAERQLPDRRLSERRNVSAERRNARLSVSRGVLRSVVGSEGHSGVVEGCHCPEGFSGQWSALRDTVGWWRGVIVQRGSQVSGRL